MADTIYKLKHTGAQIDSAIDNAVRSDAQILTSEQQTQARTNIGAASTSALTTETNARTTADTGVRGLTATVEATSTASKAYVVGDYFVYNGLLYKCTAAIAKGGTITPGTNCTATTAGAEISTLSHNLGAEAVYIVTTNGTITTASQSAYKYISVVIFYESFIIGNITVTTADFTARRLLLNFNDGTIRSATISFVNNSQIMVALSNASGVIIRLHN